ncbi:hypothetical protein D9M73_250450 [compost metagenome]
MAACRACLAAGVEAVGHYHFAAAHVRLVLQLPPHLEKAHVGDRTRQMPVFHHAAHVQIFNADGMEAARQVRRELVQGIRADGGDASMQLRQLCLRLATIGRSLDLARQAAR